MTLFEAEIWQLVL